MPPPICTNAPAPHHCQQLPICVSISLPPVTFPNLSICTDSISALSVFLGPLPAITKIEGGQVGTQIQVFANNVWLPHPSLNFPFLSFANNVCGRQGLGRQRQPSNYLPVRTTVRWALICSRPWGCCPLQGCLPIRGAHVDRWRADRGGLHGRMGPWPAAPPCACGTLSGYLCLLLAPHTHAPTARPAPATRPQTPATWPGGVGGGFGPGAAQIALGSRARQPKWAPDAHKSYWSGHYPHLPWATGQGYLLALRPPKPPKGLPAMVGNTPLPPGPVGSSTLGGIGARAHCPNMCRMAHKTRKYFRPQACKTGGHVGLVPLPGAIAPLATVGHYSHPPPDPPAWDCQGYFRR